MLNTPRALKSFLILAPHPKSLRQIGEPLVFRTNFGSVGIALLRSNGRKGRQPFQWKCAPHRPVPPSLFIQNHSPNREPLVFRNELRKRVRTSHGRFVFYWGNGEGIEVLAKPIFVRGVSPFNGWHASCPHWKLALYRLLLLAQKKLYKTFEWDSILTQFSFSRQPSNKTRHVRYRTKSKRDNRKPAQCQ